MPIMTAKKQRIIPAIEPNLLSPCLVVANDIVDNTNPRPANGIPIQFKKPKNGINATPVPIKARMPQIKLSVDIYIFPHPILVLFNNVYGYWMALFQTTRIKLLDYMTSLIDTARFSVSDFLAANAINTGILPSSPVTGMGLSSTNASTKALISL